MGAAYSVGAASSRDIKSWQDATPTHTPTPTFYLYKLKKRFNAQQIKMDQSRLKLIPHRQPQCDCIRINIINHFIIIPILKPVVGIDIKMKFVEKL